MSFFRGVVSDNSLAPAVLLRFGIQFNNVKSI